jgi:hypothetical protein
MAKRSEFSDDTRASPSELVAGGLMYMLSIGDRQATIGTAELVSSSAHIGVVDLELGLGDIIPVYGLACRAVRWSSV